MAKVKCYDCYPAGYDWKGKGNITLNGNGPFSESTLPQADFLVITWTKDETRALAKVLGGGKYQFTDLKNNNLTRYTAAGIPTPADPEDGTCHGYYFTIKIGDKTVVCMKCNMHPKSENERQPTDTLIKKMIGTGAKPRYKYLISTGTGGGVWAKLDLGDVVVSNSAIWGLTMVKAMSKKPDFTGVANTNGSKATGFATWYDYANKNLMNDPCVTGELESGTLCRQKKTPPQIYYKPANSNSKMSVISNDKIGKDPRTGADLEFENITAYRKCGATLDENDAFVANACAEVKFKNWVSIRNVSDLPQDESKGNSSDDQYDVFGHCSSINGSFAVWAFIMGH